MKENRQGCLSRAIKPLFQTFLKVEKVQQPVEKTFRQADRGAFCDAPLFYLSCALEDLGEELIVLLQFGQ